MIKNLLFDLGGVIMDIRKENCIAAFEQLGLKNAASYFDDYCQKGAFLSLERGDISVDEFHAELRKNLPANVTDEQIDEAFCKFLIGIPNYRLEQLENLQNKYDIYLLSNTNSIMWNSTIENEFKKAGKNREFYFKGIITSFAANSLKPELKIFEYTIKTLGISAEETLFLDDSQRNLDAASQLGLKTALVVPGMEFIDIVNNL